MITTGYKKLIDSSLRRRWKLKCETARIQDQMIGYQALYNQLHATGEKIKS
jgi:hypothetical protein